MSKVKHSGDRNWSLYLFFVGGIGLTQCVWCSVLAVSASTEHQTVPYPTQVFWSAHIVPTLVRISPWTLVDQAAVLFRTTPHVVGASCTTSF